MIAVQWTGSSSGGGSNSGAMPRVGVTRLVFGSDYCVTLPSSSSTCNAVLTWQGPRPVRRPPLRPRPLAAAPRPCLRKPRPSCRQGGRPPLLLLLLLLLKLPLRLLRLLGVLCLLLLLIPLLQSLCLQHCPMFAAGAGTGTAASVLQRLHERSAAHARHATPAVAQGTQR